ncbi:MAG: M48 family metalloprotease [Desulfobacterales bacterium]|jgi:Zn-dependent protease with chaperone function
MFGNFIYFILVLLIYLTYHPSEETNFNAFESFTLFLGLIILFAYLTRFQFQRIERRLDKGQYLHIDHQFNSTLLRQSVMAVLLFAINIYGLNLSSFLISFSLFATIPTLLALLFLILFIFYLCIVWAFAHGPYQKLYRTDISKRTYVISNISFSVPVLLPWLFLSGIADLIQALPFEAPKQFLSTTEGEVIYFLFFLVAVAVFGPSLIQKFWRCKPVEKGYYRTRIEDLCQRAGLAYADILYWPIFGGKMITAGVMGLIKKFRYILITPSLLQLLEPQEIDAVIAHEIGHIKKKHLLFYLAFFVGYMLLSYVTLDVIIFAILYAEPVYWLVNKAGFSQTTVVSGIFSVVIICVFLIYFRFIFGFFMRNFERQADTYVYALFDSAKPLITTLEKIAATSGQSADRPNWHHFSIRERIDYLNRCESDSRWIARHEQKVKKSIGAYLVILLILGVVGYQLNLGSFGDKLSNHFFEKVILRELEESPKNPNLYSLLGDIYYNSKNYAGVRDAYETSLALKPENAQVLNNLAWLYATCEEASLRDPQRALALAKLAIRLEQSPHIWDTLAESYFTNGMYHDAVDASQHALGLAKRNHSYYKDQLNKFKNALAN